MTQPGLGLVGAPNARDLGGPVTADGRRVRRGMLVRAGALGRLTDDDVSLLGKFGLACLVDLRHGTERAVAPPDRLPAPAPRVVRYPIYDADHPVFTYVSAVMLGHSLGAYARLAEKGTPAAMVAIYRWFVSAGSARASFAAAVRTLADPAHLPALFHCSAGKDRTGWLTVILLSVLGVDEAAIRRDYLLTNEHSATVQERLLEAMAARRPDIDLDAVRPMLQARAEYLDAAYAEVKRVYGSFEAYLRVGLGLDEAVFAALRANLLE